MNAIWITVDSFRQDHIHCYRPEGTRDPSGESINVQTPNMDRLAREGVKFTRMRAEALPTVPCRRGSFTGRRVFPFVEEAPMKGMYITLPGWRPIPQDDVTIAEHLSERGYTCGLVADVYHLMKPSQNFHRGYQSFQWERGQEYDMYQSGPLPEGYIERFVKPGTEMTPRRMRVLTQYLQNQLHREGDHDFQAAKTFRRAIEWLERNHEQENFYLTVESFDPHEPFEAPQRFIDMYDPDWDGPELIYGNIYQRSELTDAEHHHVRARYAAECTMVDFWIGQLLNTLDRLGLAENTVIVLMSDHGKILGEHGHYGMPPQDTGLELNAVPCFIRHPKGEHAGTTCDGWLYNTDLVATMLSMMGAGEKERMDGIDVWPGVDSGDLRDHAVGGHGQMVSCWREDWLYLTNTEQNTTALYNLADDPYRQDDVAGKYASVRDEMKGLVEAVVGE
ncbi:MAG TPA: sulfatase [Armatimonadota bacterium]|nr:sulfatase [Armatimonadota bacterium]